MTRLDETSSPSSIAEMRDRAVEELTKDGAIASTAVAGAMRTVPRHLFVPEVGPEDAYDPYRSVVTKRDADGNALSSVSDMHVQSFMLEQAQITPGMNLLEIGSGGYNAALMAEMTGPPGRVTTVDIDDWVTDRARRMLDAAGYSRVNVVLADAEEGVPEQAPYDRILVTVGAWDIPPAWVEQLADDGRLTVALRMRGLSRTVTFEKAGGHLVSVSSKLFGFVPMQGAGAHQARLLVLRDGEVTLRFDDDFDIDPGLLAGVFATSRVEEWSGALIGTHELLDTVQMWLSTTLPGFCWVVIDPDRDTGVISLPRNRTAALAVVDGADFAYVTTRPAAEAAEGTETTASVEFGVHAYGPDAARLAEQVAKQLRVWSREHRGGPGPVFRVFPAGTPDDALPAGRVIDKVHSRIVISWPQPAGAGPSQRVSHLPTR